MIIYGVKELRPETVGPASGTEKAQNGCRPEGEVGGAGMEAGRWSEGCAVPSKAAGSLSRILAGEARARAIF